MKEGWSQTIKEEDLQLLLQELTDRYGYNFTQYAPASLKRRVARLMVVDRFPSFAELLYRVRHDSAFLTRFIEEITVNVTEMFRDPQVYSTIRQQIIPVLATYPFIRIWHAGCSTGEEVYSMAILLHEAGLLHKSLLYATDLNPAAVENVSRGIFPLGQMKQYSENYIASGGKQDFSSYYTSRYEWARFDPALKKKIIPATHNLVSDRSFNEFQVIFCRNVLIYFNRQLQDQVLTLFDESLEKRGFLVLGTKENIRFSPIAKSYEPWEGRQKIWRKKI